MTLNPLRIDFEPVGKRIEVPPGGTLLEAAIQAGVEILSICGGAGSCGRCIVRDVDGVCGPAGPDEQAAFSPQELAQGWRLACRAVLVRSGRVHVPPESLSTPQRLQVESSAGAAGEAGLFQAYDLQLDPPSLEDTRSDGRRLADALASPLNDRPQVSYELARALPGILREDGWHVQAVCRGAHLAGLLTPGERALGLAVDAGTTKLAAYLVDLISGEVLARDSAPNPQIQYGEDVISRIHYTMLHPDGLAMLQRRLAGEIQRLAEGMCAGQACHTDQIVEAVAVGNPTLQHLLAGLPVAQLGLSPYVPVVNDTLEIPAGQVGLNLAPGASLYLPGTISGYVGGDHLAMLVAVGADRAEDTLIAIDIGTNTEVSLVHQGRITCCSCASGPAFEGAHIREGMRAAAGAIEKVQIQADGVRWYTIGGGAPVGLCGSGILDAVAEMVRSGVLDGRGRLDPAAPGVRGAGKGMEFVVAVQGQGGAARDITLSRRDINEILLAKAAVRAGIEILLKSAGLEAGQVGRFIVAGAFGTYLDVGSAVGIGMFPPLPGERFSQVGNAAGAGARQILVSAEARRRAEDLAGRLEYIELTTWPDFQDIYLAALRFPGRQTQAG